MTRKFLSILVLVSMVLHCSSRLGVLSYVYNKRHDVAHALGLIAEKPIATCNSNYFTDKNLTITAENDELPVTIAQAQEINLFYTPAPAIVINNPVISLDKMVSVYIPKTYRTDSPDIFHPPA